MNELIKKIKSMKPSDHLQNMVNGLRKPFTTQVKMYTFGEIQIVKLFWGLKKVHICYGCAATNAIGRLLVKPHEWLIYRENKKINVNEFIHIYESAIDNLRRANIATANKLFAELGIDPIKSNTNITLPVLNDDYTEKELKPYEELAKFNKSLSN